MGDLKVLEFIILGQIPGTNIYLSFTAVLVLAILAVAAKATITTKRYIREYHKQLSIEAKSI